jgi:hypothetical protein
MGCFDFNSCCRIKRHYYTQSYKGAHRRLQEVSLKFILIGLVLLVGLGYGGAKGYLYYQVRDHVETAVLMTAPYAELEYSGISSTLTGELTVDDVRIRVNGYRDDVQIGRLGIKTASFLALLKLSDFSATSKPGGDSTPESIGFIAQEIRVSVTADYYRKFYKDYIKEIAPYDIGQGGDGNRLSAYTAQPADKDDG